jgi:hypothetical protein
LLFNIFVYPIAWGGNVLFDGQNVNSDTYSLLIPQFFNNQVLTVLVFLGGFSAAISMIVVSSIGLSTMLTNNVLIPYNLIGKLEGNEQTISSRKILNSRKIGIFSLIMISYFIYRFFAIRLQFIFNRIGRFCHYCTIGTFFFWCIILEKRF